MAVSLLRDDRLSFRCMPSSGLTAFADKSVHRSVPTDALVDHLTKETPSMMRRRTEQGVAASNEILSTIADIQERLGSIEDKSAITENLIAYAHSIDYGDEKRWVDCFAADGVFLVHGQPPDPFARRVEGHQELAAFIAQHTRGPDYWHKHVVVDPLITIDGDGAVCDSYLIALVEFEGGPTLRLFGRYRDRLVKQPDGRWRFQERVAEVESVRGPLSGLSEAPDAAHPVEP